MAGRNWLFTINNPTDDDAPESWTSANTKLLVYQTEVGEEGTVHLQGYIELRTSRQLQWLRNNLSQRAHWEKRRGSRAQAVKYCTKDESRLLNPQLWQQSTNSWEEVPLDACSSWWNSRGLDLKTNDTGNSSTKLTLSKIQEALSADSASIEEVADEYFDMWVRYYRAFEKYVTMKTAPRNHEVAVHVIFGPTGTGKSKWCMDNYPDAYWKQRSKWWDGYFKHEAIVLDEYYAWLPFDLLLRICDRYPLLVESKGGQLQFVAKTIVFTTNKLPDEWYPLCYFPAFERRVTKWHYMPTLGIHAEYNTYNAFKETVNQRT